QPLDAAGGGVEIEVSRELRLGEILRLAVGIEGVEELYLAIDARADQSAFDGDGGELEIGDVHAGAVDAGLLFVLRVDPLGEFAGYGLRKRPCGSGGGRRAREQLQSLSPIQHDPVFRRELMPGAARLRARYQMNRE